MVHLHKRYLKENYLRLQQAILKRTELSSLTIWERRKAGLDLEELFGVIEELKQSNYIKVILIANQMKFMKMKELRSISIKKKLLIVS